MTNVSLTEHTIFTVQLDWNHTRDREYPRFWGRRSGSVEITVNCLTRICPIWSALEEGMSRFLPCPHGSSSERSMLAFISALPSTSWFEKKQPVQTGAVFSKELVVCHMFPWFQHFAALVPVDFAKYGIDSSCWTPASVVQVSVEPPHYSRQVPVRSQDCWSASAACASRP